MIILAEICYLKGRLALVAGEERDILGEREVDDMAKSRDA